MQKGTYLFHGTPDFTFDLDNLVAPDMLTDFGGFNRFIFWVIGNDIFMVYGRTIFKTSCSKAFF